MQDMLVRLYELPDFTDLKRKLESKAYFFRRPLAAEKGLVVEWVNKHFGSGWASEVDVAFNHLPAACFLALSEGQIRGFACHDAAYCNFFGPTGVETGHRGLGLGKILLLECLLAMRERGYAYAIIGGVGPARFYEKVVGASLIPGSNPGIYRGLLSEVPPEATH